MERPDNREEQFEDARRVADAAHDAVGDAEDELVAAEDARADADGAGESQVADERMVQAEADWLDRQTAAEQATREREVARDRLTDTP
jgi:hypothetical protein